MAQQITTKAPATAPYTVLRAICMHGERVEVGDSVELTPAQYAEAKQAGKVGPLVEKAKRLKVRIVNLPATEPDQAAGEEGATA